MRERTRSRVSSLAFRDKLVRVAQPDLLVLRPDPILFILLVQHLRRQDSRFPGNGEMLSKNSLPLPSISSNDFKP
jgi:hypothetical protein